MARGGESEGNDSERKIKSGEVVSRRNLMSDKQVMRERLLRGEGEKQEKQAYLNSTNVSKFLGKRSADAAQRGTVRCCSLLPSLRVCAEPLAPTGRLNAPTNTGDFSLSETASALPPTA